MTIQPGCRPTRHLHLEVLRRPVKSAQYTSIRFTEHLAVEGVRPSIGSVGDAYDNTLMEGVIGLFKTECIRTTVFHAGPYRTIGDVEYATAGWVGWYNNRRLHSTRDYLTQSSTNKPTTRLSTESRNPYESGREPGALQGGPTCGRVSLIDSDWSTFAIDVGDEDLAARLREAMRTERDRPSNVGRRLQDLVRTAGLNLTAQAEATQTWTAWNPDDTPAPDGCFSMQSLAEDLVAAGQLAPADRDRFVSTIHDAARRDRLSMRLTKYAVVAEAPTL